MQENIFLWEQHSQKTSNSAKGLLNLFFEFLVANLTILSFISLTGVLTRNYEFFSSILILIIAALCYLIFSDVFIVYSSRDNLSYAVTKEGIHYHWGLIKKRNVFVPFNEISNIIFIDNPKQKRKAVEFINETKLTNSSLGIEIGALSYILSFERISDLELLQSVITKHYQGPIFKKDNSASQGLFWRFSKSNLYHKLNLFMAFSFIYIATYIGMALFDNNFAKQILVKDVVIERSISTGNSYPQQNLFTQDGYLIKLKSAHKYLGEEVEFQVSPIYNHTTSFNSYKNLFSEGFHNSYMGLNGIVKFICFIILLFFAGYIIYKRGNLYREDYMMIIFGPVLITWFIGFTLFH